MNRFLSYFFVLALIGLTSCSSSEEKVLEEATKFFLRGNEKWADKEYQEAIRLYTEAIEKKDDFSDAFYNRGLALEEIGKNREALMDFSKAFEIDTTFSMALFKKVELLQLMGNLDQALPLSALLVYKFPDSSNYWKIKGDILLEKDNLTEAQDQFQKALSLDSNNVEALINYGIVFQKMGKLEESKDIFTKALEYGKYKSLILNNLGYIEIEKQQFERAKKLLLEAKELDPNNELIQKNLLKLNE
jgi:tetratricopeptide (TPR) repeat protein